MIRTIYLSPTLNVNPINAPPKNNNQCNYKQYQTLFVTSFIAERILICQKIKSNRIKGKPKKICKSLQ